MDAVNALKKAITVEKEAMKRYLEYARATRDASGKNMFITLALDEWDHMTILENQLQSLSNRDAWSNADVPKSDIELLIPKLKEAKPKAKSNPDEAAGDLDALETALREEQTAKEFYLKQAGLMTDAAARAMYLRLAEMEDAHYKIISAEIDSIKGNGFWLGVPEFTMD